MIRRGLTVRGAYAYTDDDYDAALRLLLEGTAGLGELEPVLPLDAGPGRVRGARGRAVRPAQGVPRRGMIVAAGALDGRTAAVSGASSGIGLATARRLHELGASVTGLARRRDAIVAGLGEGPRARALALDVTDAAAARAAFAGVDRLDVLVAAAGTNVPGAPLGELDAAGWDAVVATNLTGVFHSSTRRSRRCGRRAGSRSSSARSPGPGPTAPGRPTRPPRRARSPSPARRGSRSTSAAPASASASSRRGWSTRR